MYTLGDIVTIKSFDPPKVGEIVSWYFDEGNVWKVDCGGEEYDCCEDELTIGFTR